jgi:hypothetical protein
MQLRSLAMSIGTVVTLAAAAPSFAGSDIGTYPPAPPPESLYPFNQYNQPPTSPSTSAGQPVVVAPGSGYVTSGNTQAGTRIMTDNQGHQIVVDSAYADAPGQRSRNGVRDSTVDRTIGVVTAPGYMGPRDTRGQ